MSNNIINFKAGGMPATLDALTTGIANVMMETSGGGGETYLKLDRAGVFTYGSDGTEIEPDSLWAINVFSSEHGWISWGDGVVLGETMVPLAQPRPEVSGLPETGEKWDEQFSFSLLCLNGEDEGLECLYKGTSIGFKKAFNKLMQEVAGQLAKNSDDVIPVCKLEVSSYKHKSYGMINTPQFVVQKFVPAGETPPAAEEIEAEPAKPTRRKRGS